ncbi:Cytoplasmic dynein 2 heavy chain 1 [Portunus trituberculatus]|uniref:Cytoplasmic dynein 2 heavy chain 1 n=1 Tax=Portunus trituberculatus TaxID=210409 RepID=A0A5B7F8W9_PORTR|nr:Cytoplasmic dynein 2 heavy chain 1 [Portunus trituberculatus]
MDNLEFVTAWLRSGIPNARVAMKWSGLQMEGATFDGTRLLHNAHDSPSITVAPVCTVAWIPKDQPVRVYHEELLSVPVYASIKREQLVGSVDLPCPTPHHEWRQTGIRLRTTQQFVQFFKDRGKAAAFPKFGRPRGGSNFKDRRWRKNMMRAVMPPTRYSPGPPILEKRCPPKKEAAAYPDRKKNCIIIQY